MATDVTPDDELMERLRRVSSAADPVPHDVVLAGRSAIAYRNLDAQIAQLVEEELEASGVRGGGAPWFSFEVDDLLIEVAVRMRSEGPWLTGQVDGADPESVIVRQPPDAHTCIVDELGRFSASLTSGPMRLEIALDDGRRIATSWVNSGT